MLQGLKPADYFSNPAALGAFTRTPSPLKVLLLEVRKNTTFSKAPPIRAPSKLKAAAKVVGATVLDSGGVDAGKTISDYFRPLADYVGDGKGAAPIDEMDAYLRNTDPASNAGIPGLSLPAGLVDGRLPVGLELDGPTGDDRRLLAIGLAFEQILGTLPAPTL